MREHIFIKMEVRDGFARTFSYDEERFETVKVWSVPASSAHPEELWLQIARREPVPA